MNCRYAAEINQGAYSSVVRKIAADETFQGQTFSMEREWLHLKPAQGVLCPNRMTYPERDGKPAVAEIKDVEFNPVLSEDRFKIPALGK